MKYQLHCQGCGYKRFSDGTDLKDLTEIPRGNLCGGYPKVEEGKTIIPPSKNQRKMFKCPNCGRGVTFVKFGRREIE